jgi:hypothetical protein
MFWWRCTMACLACATVCPSLSSRHVDGVIMWSILGQVLLRCLCATTTSVPTRGNQVRRSLRLSQLDMRRFLLALFSLRLVLSCLQWTYCRLFYLGAAMLVSWRWHPSSMLAPRCFSVVDRVRHNQSRQGLNLPLHRLLVVATLIDYLTYLSYSWLIDYIT